MASFVLLWSRPMKETDIGIFVEFLGAGVYFVGKADGGWAAVHTS